MHMRKCSPETAEAWTFLKGIQLAKLIDSRQTCFESDLITIVNAINNNRGLNNMVNNIIHACKRELQSIGTWHLSFAAMNKNRAADFLARSLAVGHRMVIHDQPIESILQILEDDQQGFSV